MTHNECATGRNEGEFDGKSRKPRFIRRPRPRRGKRRPEEPSTGRGANLFTDSGHSHGSPSREPPHQPCPSYKAQTSVGHPGFMLSFPETHCFVVEACQQLSSSIPHLTSSPTSRKVFLSLSALLFRLASLRLLSFSFSLRGYPPFVAPLPAAFPSRLT